MPTPERGADAGSAGTRRRGQASRRPPGDARRRDARGRRAARPWAERARDYALLMRLDKPIGSLLLLWPTLWALWMSAAGTPDPFITAIFVVGVLLTRSAGCVVNDLADRDFDPHVERTRTRPLATGRVSPREALALCLVLCLLAFGLVLLLNRLTILLSLVAVVLSATYPFMKRYTYLPQVHLGMAFGWGVPMAWAAQTGTLPPECWLVWISVILWAVAYDTMYAMADREDDLRVGVKSTAILFGSADRLMVGLFQIAFLGVLLIVAARADLGAAFHAGLGVAALLGLYEQHLIRERDRRDCFRAFLHNNWVGAAIFAGVMADYALGG